MLRVNPQDLLDHNKVKNWTEISCQRALLVCEFHPVVIVYTVLGHRQAERVGIEAGITSLLREAKAYLHDPRAKFYTPNVPKAISPIVRACEANWEAHKNDCSGFVKAVAKDLGITLTKQANDIVDQIGSRPWTSLKDGIAASKKAESGYFVIAGLKDTPNGHVAVITPGPLANGKYPAGYWGRLGSVGKKNKTINWAWGEDDRDNVIYSYIGVTQ